MVFELLFMFGFVGLLILRMLGMSRAGHHGVGGHSLHGGAHHASIGHHAGLAVHGHSGGHLSGHGAGHGAGHHTSHPATQGRSVTESVVATHPSHFSPISLIPSPMDLFSISLGMGLTGILIRGYVLPPTVYLAAFLGGVAFDFCFVRPMFALAIRFASRPSEGLEGTVALGAEAVTHFDSDGKGLVRVNMEGQIVQLLAKLEPAEVAAGVTVSKGDQVVLTQVDSKKNSCRVTRELSQ